MTRILLGVDTEADDQWSAAGRENITLRNIAELPRLQALCDQYGVRPTYLVTYEVATGGESRNILRALADEGRCEIGSHHHPWTTPPPTDEHLFPLNLTPGQFRSQIGALTEAVAEITGQRPVSYRSGRNGFAGSHVEMLESEGYWVDSSVDPFFNERTKGGPSFAGARLEPYFLSAEDPRLPGSSRLLEIPVSSALNRRLPHRLETAYADFTPAYTFRRVLRLLGIVRPIWLRPSYSKTEDMLWLAEHLLTSKAPVANIIFHSSELIAGGSPYNSTEEDVEKFYQNLTTLLRFLAQRGVEGRTFREFHQEWTTGDRA
jgi:peptidoglycan/xylan/chitin deacetylase (PgdA/CDA1 family)